MPDNSPVSVVAAPTFQRHLRALAKKYRSLRQDLAPLLEQLEQGETPGEQIPGVGYAVFKARIKNSDVKKGKSGGYRLIYYLETSQIVVLLTIYPKSDQINITAPEIREIIARYEAQLD